MFCTGQIGFFFQLHLVPVFNLLFKYRGYLLLKKYKNTEVYKNIKHKNISQSLEEDYPKSKGA